MLTVSDKSGTQLCSRTPQILNFKMKMSPLHELPYARCCAIQRKEHKEKVAKVGYNILWGRPLDRSYLSHQKTVPRRQQHFAQALTTTRNFVTDHILSKIELIHDLDTDLCMPVTDSSRVYFRTCLTLGKTRRCKKNLPNAAAAATMESHTDEYWWYYVYHTFAIIILNSTKSTKLWGRTELIGTLIIKS